MDERRCTTETKIETETFSVKKRTAIAMLGTIAWFALAAYWVYADWANFQKFAFNEKGDFLAGFISPVVFLWLIIGYFQQGEELRQNTEALRIQADELKNAVAEYKALVDATTRQVDLIENEQKERRAQEIRLNQLMPRYVGGSSTTRGGFREHVLKIANMGQTVTEVNVSCSVLGMSGRQVRLKLKIPGIRQNTPPRRGSQPGACRHRWRS
jgi:hypothetical protein